MTIWNKLSDNILYIFAVSMTLSIFQFHRIQLSLLLLILYMVIVRIDEFKAKLTRGNCVFIALGCLSIISTCLCLTSNMGNTWKLSGVFNEGLFVILVVFKLFYSEYVSTNKIDIIIKGLKLGCLLNFAWCYVQLAFYNIAGIDINDLIFHQTLNLMEVASARRDGIKLCLSGFGWHPAQLVPIIVLSFFLFDSFFIRLLILGACVFSNNSTCLVAGVICIVGSIIIELINGKGKISARRILNEVLLLLFVFIATLIKNDFLFEITDKFAILCDRIGQVFQAGDIKDNSTFLHARYYTFYPTIFEKQNIIEKLFGLGYECSGYPYSIELEQYTSLNDWIPETDYINFIIGRGWIWTLVFYAWMVINFIKARKISAYYFLYMLIIVACGVMYNNQFWWVIIAEIIMIEATKNNKNIFDTPLSEKISLAGL